jgi:hypothetical protein
MKKINGLVLTLALALGLVVLLLLVANGWSQAAAADHSESAASFGLQSSSHYVSLDGLCGGLTPCYTTVQAAVDAAVAGDDILVATGVYTGVNSYGGLAQSVYLTKTLTLRGGYSPDFGAWDPAAYPTTLDAEGQGRVFYITGSGIAVTISGATIAKGTGQDGGGIVNLGGTLNVIGCTFSGNGPATNGGAISNRSNGKLNVSNSTFVSNTAGNGGGIDNRAALTVTNSTFFSNTTVNWGAGIYNYTLGNATVTGSTFSNNRASDGSGICNHRGSLDVTGSTFSGNRASGHGGGIYHDIYNQKPLTVTDSTLISNSAGYGGGISNLGTLIVAGSTFISNTANVIGGGIGNGGTLTVTGSAFAGNTAVAGGGGIENVGPLTVNTSTFADNTTSDGTGGGICNHNRLNVTGSTFSSNNATYGGGIHNFDTLAVAGSTFLGNSVSQGGGINNEGAATVVNSTFKDNNATAWGGGILNWNTLTVTNCTLSANGAYTSGGGIYNDGEATLVNTIIANSTAGGDCGEDPLQPASTHNLDTDATCTPGFTQTSSVALNLQWTGWVYALVAGSVAIDTGTNIGCPSTDQLGHPRPRDGDGDGNTICDVGAYEVQPLQHLIHLPLVLRHSP